MRILLGIDPGFADMGYGVIAVAGSKEQALAYGSIVTSPKLPQSERLARIYEGLAGLIVQYKPESAAIEKLFFSKNVTTGLAVAEARGVIRLCIAHHGLRCTEFSPAEVKMAVCGVGNAEKAQMQKMTKLLLGLAEIPKPDDAADGLALAIALAHTPSILKV